MCGKTWKNPEPRAVALLETPHPWTMLWQPLPGTLGPQAAKKKRRKVLWTQRKCQVQQDVLQNKENVPQPRKRKQNAEES